MIKKGGGTHRPHSYQMSQILASLCRLLKRTRSHLAVILTC